MTLSERGRELLAEARKDSRGIAALSEDVYARAQSVIDTLPKDMPAPVVKALADGTLMFYWNKTNLLGYDEYDRLELRVEVMPSLRVYYDWEILPSSLHGHLTRNHGLGILRADSPVTRLLEAKVHNAIQTFAVVTQQ